MTKQVLGQHRWTVVVVTLAVLFVTVTVALANRPVPAPIVPLSSRGSQPTRAASPLATSRPADAFRTSELATFAAPWAARATACTHIEVGEEAGVAEYVRCTLPGLTAGTGLEMEFLAGDTPLGCADEFVEAGLPESVGLHPAVVKRPDGKPGLYCESTVAGSPAADDSIVNGLMINWTGSIDGYPVTAKLVQTFPTDSTVIFASATWPALRAYWRSVMG
jgi:hypothetical protein